MTLALDAKTMVRRNRATGQASLSVGDWALVHARTCKADLANGAAPTLTATSIVARSVKP